MQTDTNKPKNRNVTYYTIDDIIQKRDSYTNKVVAISGTCGKTTTTAMIRAVLSTIYNVTKSFQNSNGSSGIYWCINSVHTLDADYWIQEIGIASPGGMKRRLDLVRPDIRVLTNIYESHTEFFNTKEEYFAEKLYLLESAPPNSTVIINSDDARINEYVFDSTKNLTIYRCGSSDTDDIQLLSYTTNPDYKSSTAIVRIAGQGEFSFQLNGVGRHYAQNACLAIACGIHCNVSVDNILAGLSSFMFLSNRGSIVTHKNLVIYKHTYNLIAKACLENLKEFRNIASEQKIIVISGDVCEIHDTDRIRLYTPIINEALATTKHVIIFAKPYTLNPVLKEHTIPVLYQYGDVYKKIMNIRNTFSADEKTYIFFQTDSIIKSESVIDALLKSI